MKYVEWNRIQSYLMVKKLSTASSVVFIKFNKKADPKKVTAELRIEVFPFLYFQRHNYHHYCYYCYYSFVCVCHMCGGA